MRRIEDKEQAASFARLMRTPEGQALLDLLTEERDALIGSLKSATPDKVERLVGKLIQTDDLRDLLATAPDVWSRLSAQKVR